MDGPKVGERRASTLHGQVAFAGPYDPPTDAVWTVEEWDGANWRYVGKAKGERERDQLLQADPG